MGVDGREENFHNKLVTERENKMGKLMKRLMVLLMVGVGLFFPAKTWAASASLYLMPATKVVDVGGQFKVDIMLDTGGAEVSAVDAVLNYPADKLEYVSAQAGTILPQMAVRSNTAGSLSLNFISSSGTYSGTGKLATITFKAKAAGSAPVTFKFVQGSTTNDSNVVSNNEDILATVSGGTYTIQAGGSNDGSTDQDGTGTAALTNTPTPAAGSSTVTPTLPVTGPTQVIGSLMMWGMITFLIGVVGWLIF